MGCSSDRAPAGTTALAATDRTLGGPRGVVKKGKGGRKAANPSMTDEERRQERILKNRVSAMKSLQKKKRYTDDLEQRAKALTSQNHDLKNKIYGLLGRLNQAGYSLAPPAYDPREVGYFPSNADALLHQLLANFRYQNAAYAPPAAHALQPLQTLGAPAASSFAGIQHPAHPVQLAGRAGPSALPPAAALSPVSARGAPAGMPGPAARGPPPTMRQPPPSQIKAAMDDAAVDLIGESFLEDDTFVIPQL